MKGDIVNKPFQSFERQIIEEKNQIRELKEAFDLIADQLVVCEQRERDLKALLIRVSHALESCHDGLIIELRNAGIEVTT